MSLEESEILRLLAEADELPEGPLRVGLCEQAVRLADLAGARRWQFHARSALICAAFMAGEGDKIYPALAWCLAECETHPQHVDWFSLLWQCKHALSMGCAFPDISRRQIEQMGEDVSRRYARHGASPRGPYSFRMLNQLSMGSWQRAAEFRELWRAAPADQFTESPDWECCMEASYALLTGDADRAVATGLPVVERQLGDEHSQPWMLALLTPELFKRGEIDLLARRHRQAYRLYRRNPKHLSAAGSYLLLLGLTHNFQRALTLLERHLPWRLKSRMPATCFRFDLKSWCLLRQMQAHGNETVKLRLPAEFPLDCRAGVYETAVLVDWFERQTRDLEARFNHRNGNAECTKTIDETLALAELAVDYELK
jgi:hypothetical protein